MSNFETLETKLVGLDERVTTMVTAQSSMVQSVNVATELADKTSADVTMIREALVGQVDGPPGLIERIRRLEGFKTVQIWAGRVFVGAIIVAAGAAVASSVWG